MMHAYCITPKFWIGDYVTAILEKDKDKINDPIIDKVIIFVTQFGNGAHIPVSPRWIGKRVFIKRVKDR